MMIVMAKDDVRTDTWVLNAGRMSETWIVRAYVCLGCIFVCVHVCMHVSVYISLQVGVLYAVYTHLVSAQMWRVIHYVSPIAIYVPAVARCKDITRAYIRVSAGHTRRLSYVCARIQGVVLAARFHPHFFSWLYSSVPGGQ